MKKLIIAHLPQSRPSPFKGEDRWGMGILGAGDTHPHPDPPLEGEGEFLLRKISANKVKLRTDSSDNSFPRRGEAGRGGAG